VESGSSDARENQEGEKETEAEEPPMTMMEEDDEDETQEEDDEAGRIKTSEEEEFSGGEGGEGEHFMEGEETTRTQYAWLSVFKFVSLNNDQAHLSSCHL